MYDYTVIIEGRCEIFIGEDFYTSQPHM